ncbi:AMP-binding protein [uncultured Treponema sp.]|uniref:AMP-binding protein n=1 Tax=uncultured Treponema sp. TaxID=162155 RepID=UPI0025EF5ECE|nr:AMP-binding protein [uncultured Treponema sp.]
MKFSILDYLEETAKKYPDKTAFADTKTSITWKELVLKARALSAILSAKFEAGTAIPIMIDKSVKTVEYFFAALYSGCFYSYFDATFPDSRLDSMIQTLQVKKIIADSRFEKKISNLNVQAFFVNDIEKQAKENKVKYNDSRKKAIIDTDAVYANFTSGSTGMPKAVVVSHRSVIDFISCFTEIFNITANDNIANQAPFDFDVSVKDIFSAVFTGATVHLIPKLFFSFPTKLLDYLVEREITTLIWAVSALCIISTLNGFEYKIPKKINKILFSGEVMPCKQLEIWMKNIPEAQYTNLYGPTEITCNCSYYKIPKGVFPPPEKLPIGIPFPNERILLLDENNKLVTEPETEAELCVSGTCVALGYYNSVKTEEVFVQNPLQKARFERIYRTGDLVKYGNDGLLYYVGRKDTQIKHMGHRIELDEIEGEVTKHSNITRACCVFADNKISAFYTGQQTEKKDIVSMLKMTLPTYMIPGDFIHIDEFPLTKNGKIDKRKLIEKISNF